MWYRFHWDIQSSWLLNLPQFELFLLLLFTLIGIYENWMFLILSCMVFYKRKSIWSNLKALFIQIFLSMFASLRSPYVDSNKPHGLGSYANSVSTSVWIYFLTGGLFIIYLSSRKYSLVLSHLCGWYSCDRHASFSYCFFSCQVATGIQSEGSWFIKLFSWHSSSSRL